MLALGMPQPTSVGDITYLTVCQAVFSAVHVLTYLSCQQQ
jgi:hypothetical protein